MREINKYECFNQLVCNCQQSIFYKQSEQGVNLFLKCKSLKQFERKIRATMELIRCKNHVKG